MNGIQATILYDGSYAKTQCENCGYVMSRRYRAFPRTGGSFSIAACDQECAEAAYISARIQELIDDAKERIGVEAAEEHYEDGEFFLSIIGDKLAAATTAMTFALGEGVSLEMAFGSAMLAAIVHYREWLLDRGVDVRALEGRR